MGGGTERAFQIQKHWWQAVEPPSPFESYEKAAKRPQQRARG